MAHNLYQQTMAFTGEIPWHGLGTKFEAPFTAEEAIEAARLGYEVRKEPLYRQTQDAEGNPLLEKVRSYATVNGDTNTVLGVVGERYTPIQNREAFCFFDELLLEAGATYETAGALGDGERIWIMARIPESFSPLVGDLVNQYCLLTNSHDGSSPVQVRFTGVRVVCQNTMTAAMRGTRETVNVIHSTNARERLQLAGQILKAMRDHFAAMGETFEQFAEFQVDDAFLEEYKIALYGDPWDMPEGAARTTVERRHEAFQARYENGLGTDLPGVKGSMWGAYNSAIEWADYAYPIRSTTERTKSILFGAANDFRQKAFDAALAMMKGGKL